MAHDRGRILERGAVNAVDEVFRRIIRVAADKGIKLGSIQIVDATHSIANIDVSRDDARKDEGNPPRVGDAS